MSKMSKWPTIRVVRGEVEQSDTIWGIHSEMVQTSLPPGEYVLIPKDRVAEAVWPGWFVIVEADDGEA